MIQVNPSVDLRYLLYHVRELFYFPCIHVFRNALLLLLLLFFLSLLLLLLLLLLLFKKVASKPVYHHPETLKPVFELSISRVNCNGVLPKGNIQSLISGSDSDCM